MKQEKGENKAGNLKKYNQRIKDAAKLYGKDTREFRLAGRRIKFGYNLMIFRRQSGLSQMELAKRCSVTREYIGYIEVGKKTPGKKLIEKLVSVTNWNEEDAFAISETGSLSVSGKVLSVNKAKKEFAGLLQKKLSYPEFLSWCSALKYRYDVDHVPRSQQETLPDPELYISIGNFNLLAGEKTEELLFQMLALREFSLERWIQILSKFRDLSQSGFEDFLSAVLLTGAAEREMENTLFELKTHHPEAFKDLQSAIKKLE